MPVAEPHPAVKAGLRLFIAAAVVLVAASAGCSKNTNAPATSTPGTGAPGTASTSTAPETSSVQSTAVSLSATPAAATAGPVFVGNWHVHGATMEITPTTATITASNGACGPGTRGICSETDTLTVATGGSTQLMLKVTAVTYQDSSGANAPNPPPGPQTAVGDTLQLTSQAPGLLKATILQGFPGWVGGNPYWCGQGISQSDARRCGA
jgi:hypothetical protein